MNCPKCGSVLPQGAQFCNVCNEPILKTGYVSYGQPQQGFAQVSAGYGQGYEQPPQGYATAAPGYAQGYDPAQPQAGAPGYGGQAPYPQGFQQSYAHYNDQQPSYPPGYQPIYGGYNPAQTQREPSAFLAALARLPRMLLDSFRDPGAVLQGMMERHDLYTPPVVIGLSLLMAFLGGIAASRGLMTVLMNFFATLTGASNALASVDGINRLAGGISVSVGGMAALCQLVAVVVPMAVMLVYLCGVCKARFSFELLAGLVTTLTLPTVPVALLTLLTSLFSPLLALLLMAAAMVISYVFMGSLTARLTGKPDGELVKVKIVMILLAMVITLLLIALVVGLLSGGVFRSVMARLAAL